MTPITLGLILFARAYYINLQGTNPQQILFSNFRKLELENFLKHYLLIELS